MMSESHHVDRRGFLVGAALTGLGMGLVVEELHAQQGTATDEKPAGPPVGCAVIGLGLRGRETLAALAKMPNAPVAAICDSYTSEAYVKRAQTIAPAAAFKPDYREVLAMPGVQAVFVDTPSHLHKQIALDALQAGKHVYCEAPLATEIADAKAIAQAAAASKSVFQAGLQYRANKMHNHARNFLGDMGKPVAAQAQWRRKTTWKGAAPTPERERELSWRIFRATSSGLPGEVGIHEFDVISWYLKELPVAVMGFGGPNPKDGMEVPDTVQCVFEYPSGVRMGFDATLCNSFDGSYELIMGPAFAMLIRDQRGWMFKETDSPLLGWEVYARKDKFGDETGIALVADATKLMSQGKEPGKVGADVSKSALYQSVAAFLDSARSDKKPAADAEGGYQATVIARMAHDACMSGSRIEIPAQALSLA
jgi:predicted dehydrogenase